MKGLSGFCIVLLCSCATTKIQKQLVQMESEFQDHVGFLLYDPVAEKNLISHNSDKYFTPASNTKIFTLYASLQIMGDTLPALYYEEIGDSLIIWGSGDPSFLYPWLPQTEVFEFLSQSDKHIYFSDANFSGHTFGPGWAWDDYSYSFSSEKSPLPIYGNTLTFRKELTENYPSVQPSVFKSMFFLSDSVARPSIQREYGSNTFFYSPSNGGSLDRQFPYRYSGILTTELLADTLKRGVRYIDKPLPKIRKKLFNYYADSLYKEMMQQSDNFIAEQLLLMSSGVISDTLESEIGIKHIKQLYFSEMPDDPIWKDGSGLSRYNLFTPRSLVWLWNEILKIKPTDELFPLLATGGESGTLQNYYKSESPYIFGKTGTLSNNHSLSGFLITRKGKMLIFSLMNNNYPGSSSPVKKKMEQLLWEVHLNY